MTSKPKWENLEIPLSEPVMKTIKQLGFTSMTPVQAACIPLFQKSKDVAAEAVTGSGKTLAFVIPALEIMLKRETKWKKHEVGAIIISPTRELALQTYDVVKQFLMHINFSQLLLVGGNSVENDLLQYKLNGGNIIIATPGRFEDVLIRHACNLLPTALKSLEILVLDEADRLLDLGFEESLNNILRLLPKQRRTGLFSATQTKEVKALIRAGLRNPVIVSVKEKVGSVVSTPISLTNYYLTCEANEKLNTLIGFITNEGGKKKYIIFFATCASVQWFSVLLKKKLKNETICTLHGKMGKNRYKILEDFRKSNSGLLLATDLMARGIDIPEVDWVLQFDPPSSPSAFVHRVGRTARNGQIGSSLLFLLPTEDSYVEFIQKNQKVELTEMNVSWECPDTLKLARNLQLKDRANFDYANRAYVSFIQSYAKHECSLIFRLKDLPFGRTATGFGLLKLPKMPEMKNKVIDNFEPCEVDLNSIKYANKNREKIRQSKLKIYAETNTWPTRKDKKRSMKTVPWELSKKKKLDKKEKKKHRKELGIVKKKRKRSKISEEEMASLAKDVALISKLKRKKISEEDFDKEFGCGEFS